MGFATNEASAVRRLSFHPFSAGGMSLIVPLVSRGPWISRANTRALEFSPRERRMPHHKLRRRGYRDI